MTFLRTALNAQRRKRGEEELCVTQHDQARSRHRKEARINSEMLRRPLDVDFRRREEAQRDAADAQAELVLDETDSGLDIDALKIVADGTSTSCGRANAA